LFLLLAAAVGLIVFAVLRRNGPPSVNFTRVHAETLVSTLATNGKVEPFEWRADHAETKGLAGEVNVSEGHAIVKGAVIAVLSDPSAKAELDAAEAKVAEAQANLASLEAGPKPAELTEIENGVARANVDLRQAERELATEERLAAENAATGADVTAARDKVDQLHVQIAGLEKRRATMPATAPDVAGARARLQDAQATLELVKRQAEQSEIHAPMSGIIYGLAIRAGAYLNAGDLVANIGLMDRLRVRVYIDEPELGRVAKQQPVTITWQALPGKQWQGVVEQMPTTIETLGSRQVGQVICVIENPGRELVPGTNVDALIRTAVVDHALVIPKETLHHDAAGDYVLLLKGDSLERRAVKTGASSVTRIQATDGLAEGDAIAMPSDTPLKAGDRVTVAPESSK
jgi:multidrug efflux pump subunit AcrA (membrane-fusion protein)